MATQSLALHRARLFLGVLTACFCAATAGAQIIVDNADAGFSVLSGTWSSGDFGQPWGADYRWSMTTGSGASPSFVEWRPTFSSAGWYAVDVYYVDGGNRTDNAPFTVHHADGSDTELIDQTVGGESWVSLGVYYFESGSGGAVELSNQASSSVVVADAVRFTALGPLQDEFRGMWIDVFHVGFKNASEVDTLIARALDGNYNAILPEMLAFQDNGSNAHGAYWNSSIVPKAPDIAAGFDPLAYLVQQAHAAGIEVHPWLVPFRVSSSWPPAGNSILANNPEWLMVEQSNMGSGPRKIGDHYTLDPSCPEVQDYLISIVEELTSNYAIDGIHWDYIRYTTDEGGYPAYTWFDNSGLERFKRITGYSGTPPTDNAAWSDFRRRGITELIRRSHVVVSTADNPRQPLRHTAALITWGNAPASFEDTSSWGLFQNWEYWLEEGYLDAGIPMAYFREWEYPTWYRNWVDKALVWSHDRDIFVGQGTYLNTFADNITQLDYALNAGAFGAVTYSYYGTSSAGNDWSWYSYVGGLTFLDPAVTPTMPWRDPNTTTRGTIYGRVADGVTGLPIDDATVLINGFNLGRTDGNGFFVMTDLPAGTTGNFASVGIVSAGYALAERPNVRFLPAGFTEANIGLGDWLPGDYDVSGAVTYADFERLAPMLTGPDLGPPAPGGDVFDINLDLDVDLADFWAVQQSLGN